MGSSRDMEIHVNQVASTNREIGTQYVRTHGNSKVVIGVNLYRNEVNIIDVQLPQARLTGLLNLYGFSSETPVEKSKS